MLILGFSSIVAFSQKKLSGNLNQPKAHVITIGADRVTVDDVAGFSTGDTILLIQMQGVGINTPTLGYGFIQNVSGQPGRHEFLIIESVDIPTDEIIFRNDIIDTYVTLGNIQIVRVPYFNSAIVTAKLFCDPWNSTTKKGGVLALVIGRTITLNADIDVSKSGFTGGKDSPGDGRCVVAPPATDIDFYSDIFTNAGYKGEGIAIHDDFEALLAPIHVKGMGPNFTGGGGGNGRYSGGGGGSNRGTGGIGGSEDNTSVARCSAPYPGGKGGYNSEQPSFPLFINRIFFGGGGGASTSPTGLSPSGGNGGGIVIIVADTIIGKGGKILAGGGDGGVGVIAGGSGGAGGGGTIALSLNSYGSTPLTFSVSGGKGGDNLNYGEGGGGGGGFIYVSKNTTGNVTNNLDGGLAGNYTSTSTSDGTIGEKRVGFKAVLNGFLFNSIRSSITGNQIDSVCSNMIPPKITGTKPVGGTSPYTYIWEKSYNQIAWVSLTNDSPDATNYTPTQIEIDKVWFRRIITDSSIPTFLADTSKPVQMIVQPFIKNNIVGDQDTICFNGDPPAFTSKATLLDGNGIFTFNWTASIDNSIFSVPSNPHNAEGYTPPPALVKTSWYKRTVTSGRCIDETAIVKITVLDTVANNKILNSSPDICYGMTFTNLAATTTTTSPALTGGDNLYRFMWESNINGGGWVTAPGLNTGPGYIPAELSQRIPSNQYIYRRIVASGSNDVCISVSNAVLLKDFPVIINNTITANQVICSGSKPAILTGSNPLNGNGIYMYTWQDSTRSHTWTDISGEINTTHRDYQPPPLTDTTRYRRFVISSACSDVSKSITIIVHKPILNNNISLLQGGQPDTTICNGQKPNKLIGTLATGGIGTFNYQWLDSTITTNLKPVPGATLGSSISPSSLTITTIYIRQITSGACILSSNSTTITVLPLIASNTISGNTKVCFSRVPDIIKGVTLSGGSGTYNYLWEQSTDGGSVWGPATGPNNTPDYQAPALFTAAKYKRTVKSGLNDCCSNTSNVFDIGIDPLPASPVNAGPDTMIFSVEKIYHMRALSPLQGETGAWRILNNGTNSIDDTTNYKTIVRYLTLGQNSFLWTISRGLCSLKDSVKIELLKDFIPQAFSPNGDGWNNTFVIEGLNKEDNYLDLSIVNGAGTEVFSTSNRNSQEWTDWEGKNSNGLDLSEGTYYYMLKIAPIKQDGKVYKKSGFIILKRY